MNKFKQDGRLRDNVKLVDLLQFKDERQLRLKEAPA